jgi:hypothetical protein
MVQVNDLVAVVLANLIQWGIELTRRLDHEREQA